MKQGDHRDVVVQTLEAEGYSARPRWRMMRVDKWLWTSRLVKTRSLATDAAKGGRVHVNGVAVKPSREVVVGDELELTLGPVRRTVIVRGSAERRVSASEATNSMTRRRPASLSANARRSCAGSVGRSISAGARPSATAAASTPGSASACSRQFPEFSSLPVDRAFSATSSRASRRARQRRRRILGGLAGRPGAARSRGGAARTRLRRR